MGCPERQRIGRSRGCTLKAVDMAGDTTPDLAALTKRLCDPERLRPWLDAQGLVPGEPLAVERITTGHSNETFLMRRGDREWILRRPPRVPLAPTAHDMAREARLLRALAETAVPVPRLAAACTDAGVIGA